jgi:hypothetical protein
VALEFQLVAGLLTAAAVAYAMTPVAMRAAVRLQFLDKPAGYKGHAKRPESIVQLTTGQAFVVKAGEAADRH